MSRARAVLSKASGRWSDLMPRVLSALVMLLVGGLALWAGGIFFLALVLVATAVMIWELSQMTRGAEPEARGRDYSWALAVLAALVLGLNLVMPSPWPFALLFLPTLLGLFTQRKDAWAWALYSPIIMVCGLAFVLLRATLGLPAVLCILATVVAADVLGYFVGRLLGGPKFWPRFSPKKTWSGTIAGWIGAVFVGFGFWVSGYGSPVLIWLLPLIALAGQLGDIVESAIKRRAGVKDASNLIPGHGGVLDRFDALAFAAILAMILEIFVPFLPQSGI